MKVPSKPVVVGLSGGLGNQLFQYAAGRALSLRLGVDLVLDTTWFHGHPDRTYALEPFSINANIYSGPDFLPEWLKRVECRLTRRWAGKRLAVPIFRELHFHFNEAYSLLKHPVYLEGFWQSERYFIDFKKIITKDLMLKSQVSRSFNLIADHIQQSDAICIHIRRGDYVTNPIASKTHGLCSLDYIHQGVKMVSKDLIRPYCFIFSDDPGWVRKNLTLDLPLTVVDFAKPHEPHLDLALMMQCKHFVIANSSFSWWGAWLSDNLSKRIVAPKKWFASPEKCVDDLIPETWMKL